MLWPDSSHHTEWSLGILICLHSNNLGVWHSSFIPVSAAELVYANDYWRDLGVMSLHCEDHWSRVSAQKCSWRHLGVTFVHLEKGPAGPPLHG